MNKMRNNVVFLGCSGDFGRKFSACNTKIEFMIRGLRALGDCCVVHNGIKGSSDIREISYSENSIADLLIEYPCKINRYLSPLINYWRLIGDLRRLHRNGDKNIVILEAPYIIYYWMMLIASKFCGYKVVVISHEWLALFKTKNVFKRFLHHCYTSFFCYGIDAILPISEYIIQKVKCYKKPFLKLPVLADFSRNLTNAENGKYFMYCVSAEYIRVITVLLDGFNLYRTMGGGYRFVLVLSGSDSAKERVRDKVKDYQLSDCVELTESLQYDALFSMYTRASALVLPLDPKCEQDSARFSQKTAEYLSSGGAIITNPVGENVHYFKNEENVIMTDFSALGFCNAFRWVELHPHETLEIGRKGYVLGKKYFDYNENGRLLHDFILGL